MALAPALGVFLSGNKRSGFPDLHGGSGYSSRHEVPEIKAPLMEKEATNSPGPANICCFRRKQDHKLSLVDVSRMAGDRIRLFHAKGYEVQERKETHPSDQDDVVFLVGAKMKEAGVEGLPQNYALFYRVHIGGDESLRARLDQLGAEPRQEQLEELFRDVEIDPSHMAMIDGVHGRVVKLAGEIMELLAEERTSLEKYVDLLDCTTSGISDRQIGQELLSKIASILSNATSTTLRQSLENADHMGRRSAELQEIKKELEAYKSLADTDELTGLWNRRAFNRSLTRIYQDKRQLFVSSLILIDIDRFKSLNDRHGHLVGDRVLQEVADLMKSKCGPHISIYRIGGEEFALIVEGLGDASTLEFADRLRQAVENHDFNGTGDRAVTISAGICKATDGSGPEDLFSKADTALYASKASGRNRVTAFPLSQNVQARKNWMLYQGE